MTQINYARQGEAVAEPFLLLLEPLASLSDMFTGIFRWLIRGLKTSKTNYLPTHHPMPATPTEDYLMTIDFIRFR